MSPVPTVQRLEEICAAVESGPSGALTFAGRPVASPADLVYLLYELAYARPFDRRRPPRIPPAQGHDPDFLRRLEEAHPGRDGWEAGWTVAALDPGGVATITKGGTVRLVPPGAYASTYGPYAPVLPGMPVTAWIAKGFLDAGGGFFVAWGDADPAAPAGRGLVRVYWNLGGDAAPRLLAELGEGLNGRGIPYQLKILCHPRWLAERTDGAVLYLASHLWSASAPVVAGVAESLSGDLGPDVPLFVEPLAPGVGLAEDPGAAFGTGESFGLHRCRLVATALFEAHGRRAGGVAERMDWIRRHFRRHGLALERAHLNPGSACSYSRGSAFGDAIS